MVKLNWDRPWNFRTRHLLSMSHRCKPCVVGVAGVVVVGFVVVVVGWFEIVVGVVVVVAAVAVVVKEREVRMV